MGLTKSLLQIIEESKKEFEKVEAGSFYPVEVYDGDAGLPPFDAHLKYRGNRLVKGDNLRYMKTLLDDGYGGRFKLIYIDPPFFSQNNYRANTKMKVGEEDIMIHSTAYEDHRSSDIEDYLEMLTTRLLFMRELLSEEGSVWIHLDWHVVHYVKVIMDEIFGMDNFVNEVIWKYKSGGTSKHHFSRKHDTLLFYRKGKKHDFHVPKEKSYNRGYKPYRFKGVKEYKDELGWYTMVNMKDVWEIDMVGRTSAERTGYATQKPEALLERILECCTKPGDLCGDFFSGAGTLAAAAQKKELNWICCDMGQMAIGTSEKRIVKNKGSFLLEYQEGIDVPDFKLEYEVSLEDVAVSDMKKLSIRLLSYDIDPESLPLDDKNREKVRQVLKNNSLDFIDQWSLDLSHNGKLQNAEKVFIREGKTIETEYTGFVEDIQNVGSIGLRAVDIFGNQIRKAINI